MDKNIPVLHLEDITLAAAYERALQMLYQQGTGFRTRYDKPGDPLSVDCTMSITVRDPLSDPMIHRASPCNLEALYEYVMELKGTPVRAPSALLVPEEIRKEYPFYRRFRALPEPCGDGVKLYDQVDYVVQKLAKQPFTRQAQIITWVPRLDMCAEDPPTLQSIWYRIVEEEGKWWLNCNVRMRSNDAWGACFMNMFGMVIFNRDIIARELARHTGRVVEMGRLNWFVDSFHIYGRDMRDVRHNILDQMDSGSFAKRVRAFHSPDVQAIFRE